MSANTLAVNVSAVTDVLRPVLGSDGMTEIEREQYGQVIRKRLNKPLTAEQKAERMRWLVAKLAA